MQVAFKHRSNSLRDGFGIRVRSSGKLVQQAMVLKVG
jgi:hypothetical protein